MESHPFSRTYGAILPISLSTVIPISLSLLSQPSCVGSGYVLRESLHPSFSRRPGVGATLNKLSAIPVFVHFSRLPSVDLDTLDGTDSPTALSPNGQTRVLRCRVYHGAKGVLTFLAIRVADDGAPLAAGNSSLTTH